MTSLFFRLHTDRTESPVTLENNFGGPFASACWLIGGGPSLERLPLDAVRDAPIPCMGVNLAGSHVIRPDFWTSYDPSARFHRSTYLDPSITKFVHRRPMDIVPETTVKVCDCPNTVFFDRDGRRGYAEFLDVRHPGIIDWGDSMVQAIDILYRLGFRTIYLAGCEMRVRPSADQQQLAKQNGVTYDAKGLFGDFLTECEQAGLTAGQLQELDPARTYHFDEVKPIRAAATTDQHYFRVAQWLRLSRRNMALAGLQLISATPNSRLNDYFPHQTPEQIIDAIHHTIGNPRTEPTRGLYTKTDPRQPPNLGPMRDYQPHNWSKQPPPPPTPRIVAVPADAPDQAPVQATVQQKLKQLRNADPPCEDG